MSLVPLVRGDITKLPVRPLFWHFPAYLQGYTVSSEQRDALFRTRPCGIIRLGEWKLHEYFEDGDLELYNLKEDIGEQTNLAESNPQKTKELHRMLVEWRQSVQAPVPNERNPKFDAEAEAAAIDKILKTAANKGKKKKRRP